MARLFECSQALDEIPKIWNHFWRAAGKVDSWNLGLGQPIDDALNRRARHDLLAFRSGVHVTMQASEIAKFADVDLQNFSFAMASRQRVSGQFLCEAID